MKVLVDTDILSEMQRAKNPRVRARVDRYELDYGPVTVSVLTVFESVQGWLQRGQQRRADIFLEWIGGAEIVSFDLDCARLAAKIGAALLRVGRPIGVVDVGLAATAIHQDRVLVTGNTAHFEYVREAGFDLKLDNWRDETR